ncbi:S8 family serine peptidase, partial [Corallococcus llansteffanensis]
GVRIVDIEGGWRTTHEDLPPLFHQGGTQINDVSWRNHGTAVLGEMVGALNGYGVTGISSDAQAGIESHSGVGVAVAVNRAAAAVGRGGIVLVEAHSPGPADGTACTCNQSQCNYIAMEYWQGEYDAIATATANGVIVVEAAGNGSANLDAAAYGGRFNRATRDSGAIIVGASAGSSRAPTCWTNYGGRVDVHGWGESVVTLGYGDRFGSAYGEDQFYTSTFSGTSSASPVVTGAAASVQGVALASGRAALDSRAMRSLLASTGTAQSADARNIGPLPDLRRAVSQLQSGCRLMAPGTDLLVGQSVTCDGSTLVHQTDGNVVLYQGGHPRWYTGTQAQTQRFAMQTDGHLVLYATNGAVLWVSNTAGNGGARLDLEQACNLVIRATDGRALWQSNTRCVTQACGGLQTEDRLYSGQSVQACGGRATLSYQVDGNLVVYRYDGAPLWHSVTSGQSPGMVRMQSDGNLVTYDAGGRPVWASSTAGQNGARLDLQSDCNLVVYNAAGQPVWASGSYCP